MRRLVLVVLLVAGCSGGTPVENTDLVFRHDPVHGVGCWSKNGYTLSCLPDGQYKP